jgi:hypothetical protein
MRHGLENLWSSVACSLPVLTIGSLRKASRRENGDQRRFNLPPDPKLPVLAPPPNGFVVVEGFPKPAPKPIQPGSHVRVRTRLK